jgi:SAM-dependent methyltransferase
LEAAEYRAMFELEETLWWYQGMRRITAAVLERHLTAKQPRPRILDCGAGTGGSLAMLEQLGNPVAFDLSRYALELGRSRGHGLPTVQASIAAVPFTDASFDLVTVFDVLSALDRESAERSLGEIARVTRPSGLLFWREPAFMFLYGPHDRAVNVKHRYRVSEVRTQLTRHGFRPLHVSYANAFLFPLALVRRLGARLLPQKKEGPRSDVREVPPLLNTIFARILAAEAPAIMTTGLPIGLSVVALARRE